MEISKHILYHPENSILTVTAFAAEERASTRFSAYYITVSTQSSGELSVFFFVQTSSYMDTIGADHINIQRYNGSNWVTEYTFTPENTPDIQTSNACQISRTLTYNPNYSDGVYRAVLYAYAADSSGSSTVERISNQV